MINATVVRVKSLKTVADRNTKQIIQNNYK